MRLKIQSEKDFIIKGIIEQIKNFKQPNKDEYSGNLHSSLSQLVQVYMRKMAQEAGESSKSGQYYIDESKNRTSLVNQAVNQIKNDLKAPLKELGIEFDLNRYFKNIAKVLDFPGKEINELIKNLLLANRAEIIGHRQRLDSKISIPIEIRELGLRSSLEGLLVNPLLESYEINLENVRNKYSPIKGEWFPFEVFIGDFTFIIDDDGTIFVSVEKIPEKAVNDAKTKLGELANELYVPCEHL